MLADCQKRLLIPGSIYRGLLQLDGLCERWPDVAAYQEARAILDEYAEREDRPWEREERELRRQAIEAKIQSYDQMAERLRNQRRPTNRPRRNVDYPHEYARMEWIEPPPESGELPDYDDDTQAVLKRLNRRVLRDDRGRVNYVNLSRTRVRADEFRNLKEQLQGMTDLMRPGPVPHRDASIDA